MGVKLVVRHVTVHNSVCWMWLKEIFVIKYKNVYEVPAIAQYLCDFFIFIHMQCM